MNSENTPSAHLGHVISVGMQKGGVSKTTNACHIAVALGETGRRVLLWDVDENYGATKVLGVPPTAFFTTKHVLMGDSTVEEETVVVRYQKQLEAELSSEEIPAEFKETIKNYFLSLGVTRERP